jgi:fumarate hydratase subunit alpha
VVGVGLGGSFDLAALMAKRATSLPITRKHKDPRYAALEDELLARINALGIGPAGYGGATTALKVHIITAPTHIAGLPVAVNICCHVARHAEATI